MNRWGVYIKERSPVVPLLALSAGIVESARAISGRSAGIGTQIAWMTFYLFYFICLRMMDEVKDLKKDLIVHPTRPIPRGLIRPEEMKRAIVAVGLALAAFGAALGAATGTVACALAVFSVAYAFLMYHEFFFGEGLGRMPLLYAVTHQIVCVPLYSAVWFAFFPEWTPAWGYYLLYAIGAGFAFEIGRKLDPQAHPALGTYRHLSGDPRTFASFYLLLAACAYAGLATGIELMLAPFQLFCGIAALLAWQKRPKAHKLAESACILSATVHLWAPVLAGWLHLGAFK